MLAIAVLLLLASAPAAAQELACRAVDGDSLRCGRERVRIIGIYAAELHEPGGQLAKRRLEARLAQGPLSLERRGRDRYGRTLAAAFVAGTRIVQSDIGPATGRGAATSRRDPAAAPPRGPRARASSR